MKEVDLRDLAKKFPDLSKNDIRAIFMANIMFGEIETGWRYWVKEFLSLPYLHPLDKDRLTKYIRELTMNVDFSCYPIEKSYDELLIRINEIVPLLFIEHRKF